MRTFPSGRSANRTGARFGFNQGHPCHPRVDEMAADAAPGHLGKQSRHRLVARATARFCDGIEEGELDALASAQALQTGVQPEQQFEHGAAAMPMLHPTGRIARRMTTGWDARGTSCLSKAMAARA
jgi:hypothetical protein